MYILDDDAQNTPFIDYYLDTHLNEQPISKRYYKTLGTSVINKQPNVPSLVVLQCYRLTGLKAYIYIY